MARRTARAGFTLIEILIAITILVVGVAGILALFPSTIETASRAVDDTYASSIAQSVVETMSAARREARIYDCAIAQPSMRYVVFDHDGGLDQIPALPNPSVPPLAPGFYNTNWKKDFVITLPRGATGNTNYSTEPSFLFPTTATNKPSLPATDEIPASNLKTAYDGSKVIWVQRVFPLGRYREGTAPTGFATGDVRKEYLPPGATNATLPLDVYPQYSFALAVRRAKANSDLYAGVDSSDAFADNLYELRIMIFRNFDAATATQPGAVIPRSNIPIREFLTLIDVGPTGIADSLNQPKIVPATPPTAPRNLNAPPPP